MGTQRELNQRHKGLGGTTQPTETSATETKVKNANLGIETQNTESLKKKACICIHNLFVEIFL